MNRRERIQTLNAQAYDMGKQEEGPAADSRCAHRAERPGNSERYVGWSPHQ